MTKRVLRRCRVACAANLRSGHADFRDPLSRFQDCGLKCQESGINCPAQHVHADFDRLTIVENQRILPKTGYSELMELIVEEGAITAA